MNPFSTPQPRFTSLELDAYSTWFKQIDKEEIGRITPTQTVQFLTKSLLPNTILSTIWDIADHDKKGYLTENDFYVALKLTSIAQMGRKVHVDAITQCTFCINCS
jgi:hypothetical protein